MAPELAAPAIVVQLNSIDLAESGGQCGQAAQDAPLDSKFVDEATARGRGLAERLSVRSDRGPSQRLSRVSGYTNTSISPTENMTLGEARGTTGFAQEGMLVEQFDDALACCICFKPKECFFIVKGAWMLQFKSNSAGAKACDVPIPLDGATVTAIGRQDFEITNVHIKDDFYGKAAMQKFKGGAARRSFEHSVNRQFRAPCEESRDQWVQKLQRQIENLTKKLARKLQQSSAGMPVMEREDSTNTVELVDRNSVNLFAEHEEELEVAMYKLEVDMKCKTLGLA